MRNQAEPNQHAPANKPIDITAGSEKPRVPPVRDSPLSRYSEREAQPLPPANPPSFAPPNALSGAWKIETRGGPTPLCSLVHVGNKLNGSCDEPLATGTVTGTVVGPTVRWRWQSAAAFDFVGTLGPDNTITGTVERREIGLSSRFTAKRQSQANAADAAKSTRPSVSGPGPQEPATGHQEVPPPLPLPREISPMPTAPTEVSPFNSAYPLGEVPAAVSARCWAERRHSWMLRGSARRSLIFCAGSGRSVMERPRTTPTVFVQVSDPVAAGVVQSLARPGGNAPREPRNFRPEVAVRGSVTYFAVHPEDLRNVSVADEAE
jgi:hypothetical protein